MNGKSPKGVFMDSQKLKEMGVAEVVWLAVHLSGKKRRQIEEELELVPGQIDRWASRKDHHSPSLEILPELIEVTTSGREALENVIVQWLLARVDDTCLKHDRRTCPWPRWSSISCTSAPSSGRSPRWSSRQARTARSAGPRRCGSRTPPGMSWRGAKPS